jgi:hypothetical protein
MLPAFDANGNLPAGIHRCSIHDVIARFGNGSPERQVETAELIDFVTWARRASIARLLVDGSYITTKADPNDVDVVILPGSGYPGTSGAVGTQVGQWPFLHVQVAADQADLDQWIHVDFGTDRNGNPKGIVEIEL